MCFQSQVPLLNKPPEALLVFPGFSLVLVMVSHWGTVNLSLGHTVWIVIAVRKAIEMAQAVVI